VVMEDGAAGDDPDGVELLDHEELLAIRNGAWTYEEVVEYAEDMEQKLAEAVRDSALPKQPDRNFLDELCCDIIAEHLAPIA